MREGRTAIKPKICVFVHTFLKGGGGTSTLRLFLQFLSTKPLNVHLVTGPDVDPDIMVDTGNITWKCLPTLKKPLNPIADLKAFWALRQLFDREKYDLLHTNYAKPGVMGRIIGRFVGIPVVIHHIYGCTFNDTYSPVARLVNSWLERILSKVTDYYIFVGNDIYNRYKRAKINIGNNYRIVYPAMDFSSFIEAADKRTELRKQKRMELNLADDDFAIGLVSRFIEGKGHMEALRVVTTLKTTYPAVKLFLVGRGPLQEKVTRHIKKKGLENEIIILGYRNDLEALMVAWDAGIFTSFGEGMPQVLEQMVLVGLPVVTFAVDGANELVNSDKKGYVVSIGDTQAMAERIRCLIDDKEGLQVRSKELKSEINAKWEPEHMSIKIYGVYRFLLEKNYSDGKGQQLF